MNMIEQNFKALDALENRNRAKAQKLFFKNAKEYPCHETFNNLGYYLITEGLQCKNGDVRNACISGYKYLMKAANLRTTVINLNAIATATYYSYEKRPKNHLKVSTYQNAYDVLNQSVKMQYSHETEYNRLRFLYLCDVNNIEVLSGLKVLLNTFECEDSVRFYLYVLCIHSRFDECLEQIYKYLDFLDELDLVALFYLCGKYQRVVELIEKTLDNFYLDKISAAIIVECLIKASDFERVNMLATEIIMHEKEIANENPEKEMWVYKVFDDLTQSTEYRRKLISENIFVPTYIHPCCYFGCLKHNNSSVAL